MLVNLYILDCLFTVHDQREDRLRKIKKRMEIMRKHLQEPEDAWKQRKAERKMIRQQQGEEVPDRYYTELDPSQIPPPLFPMNMDENEEEEIEIELVHRPTKRRRLHSPRKPQVMGEHQESDQLTPEYDIAEYHDPQFQDYQGVGCVEEVIAVEEEEDPISMHHDPEPVFQYQQQVARVVCVAPHRTVAVQPTAYIRAQDPPYMSRPGPSSRHVYINSAHLDPID